MENAARLVARSICDVDDSAVRDPLFDFQAQIVSGSQVMKIRDLEVHAIDGSIVVDLYIQVCACLRDCCELHEHRRQTGVGPCGLQALRKLNPNPLQQ